MRSSRTRRAAMAFLAATSIASGPAIAQGIPVYDNMANLRWMEQLLHNADDMLNQLQQLQTQQTQLQSMTGDRGYGTMARNISLDSYIPGNTVGLLDGLQTDGFAGMSSEAKALRGNQANYCLKLPPEQRLPCQASIARPYETSALLRRAISTQNARLQQLRVLLDQIPSATDPARREQLHTRIAGEQAALTQGEGQINALRALVENEARIEESRRREATLENLSRPGGLTIQQNASSF